MNNTYRAAESLGRVGYRRHPLALTVRILSYTLCGSAAIYAVVRAAIGAAPADTKLFSPLIGLVLLGGIAVFERVIKRRLPTYLDVAVCLFICGALPLGSTYDFYNLVPGWDKILHTFSGFVFFMCGICVGDLLAGPDVNGRRRVAIVVVTALLVSVAVGALWEMFEYAGDSLFGMNNQRWQNGLVGETGDGNYIVTDPRGTAIVDTMTDVLLAFAGTLVCFVPVLVACLRKPDRLDIFTLVSV